MSGLRKIDTRIPRRPLLWLSAALIFTVPPLLGTLATWVPAFFLGTLTLKFWMEREGYRLRFALWKLMLAAAALAAIYFTYGSLQGIEPGVSLIVVLMSLKVLEAHTAHEFQVMVLVGWVICLCGFFLAQDLAIALCLLLAFTLLLIALVQFHRGSAAGAFWPPMRIACTLLVQALPLIALLFLFFPRVSSGFRLLMAPSIAEASGFTDRLSPGSIASLANSTEVAFRAEFPEGKVPRSDALYWRGVVMQEGDGFEWRASDGPARRSAARSRGGNAVRQSITIEPHGAHWMFALDWPGEAPAGATLTAGNCLSSDQAIRKPRRYEVRSFPQISEKELHPLERELLLQVPKALSPRIRELAQSWLAANPDPHAVVNTALRFFRTQGFRYSLTPGGYRKNDLDEFLFQRRIGFCEHYAASFATLMRLAGIPARVVAGYLGGEYNEFGGFLVVRQSEAHAWCEVWMPGSGWTRADPTSVVAPERVSLGFDSFLEGRGASETKDATFAANLARQPVFTAVRFAWQTLNYAWDTNVLNFDVEAQEAFIANLDAGKVPPLQLLMEILAGAAALLAIFVVWRRFLGLATRDRVKMLHDEFCRKAARRGVFRMPWEASSDFARRAASFLPDEAHRIRRISQAYLALRYSAHPEPASFPEFARDVRAFARTKRRP